MSLLLNLAYGLGLSIILVKAAELLIKSSSRLAHHFKVSEYTISFLVIAFATSLPELIVGIVSALDKNTALSYGNVLGSNIADLTIILAIPVFLGGAIQTKEILKNKDVYFTVFFGIIPLLLLADGAISRLDGIILVCAYIFYLFIVLKRANTLENVLIKLNHTNVKRDFVIFAFSICLLLFSADMLVKVAEAISLLAKIPLILVGLTVTALGTSLPELAFGIKAVKSHHKGEVLGNVIGSVIANSTLVLGVTAIINPIKRYEIVGITSIGFLLITLLLFLLFSISNKAITRKEASLLVILYLAFVLVEKSLAKI